MPNFVIVFASVEFSPHKSDLAAMCIRILGKLELLRYSILSTSAVVR